MCLQLAQPLRIKHTIEPVQKVKAANMKRFTDADIDLQAPPNTNRCCGGGRSRKPVGDPKDDATAIPPP